MTEIQSTHGHESLAVRAGLSVVSVGLIVMGFVPLLAVFFLNLWNLPQYQFFPLALAGSVFLFRTRFNEHSEVIAASQRGHAGVVAVWMGIAALLLATATAIWSPWLGAVAALVAYAGLLYWFGGRTFLRLMLPSWVLLLTIVPPPSFLMEAIQTPLRKIAITASSRFLDMIDVVNARSGNVIEIPGQRLFVEEACSGLNSIVFVSFTFVGYALWKQRGVWYYFVGLPLVWSFVILGNIARITSGAWVKTALGIDTMHGWQHEAIGLLLVAGYVVMVVSMDHLFSLAPRSVNAVVEGQITTAAAASAAPAPAPVSNRPASYWNWVATSVFFLLGVTGVVFKGHETMALGMAVDPSRFESVAIAFPASLSGWTQIGDAQTTTLEIQTEGHFSKSWTYQRGPMKAVLAVSYPFLGYHDVADCYEFVGWTITSRSEIRGAGKQDFTTSEVELFHSGYLHARLLMGCWSEKGGFVPHPGATGNAFQQRWRSLFTNQPSTFQLQALINSSVLLPPEDIEAQRQLFQAAGRVLSDQLNKRNGAK